MKNGDQKTEKKFFFILGYFGWYNAGDDSIGIAMIKGLLKRYPESTISITVDNDYFLSKNKFTGKIHPVPFQLTSILKSIKNSNEFIITGGTHFQDQDRSLLLKMKVFFFFSIVVKYASLVNRRPLLFGHGIGPIKKKWTLFLLKIILKNSELIIVRDPDSLNFVHSLGFKEKCVLGFDITSLLFEQLQDTSDKKNEVIGFSLLPYYTIYDNNPSKDDMIIIMLKNCITEIWKCNNNLKIHLYVFRSGKKHSDENLLFTLSNQIKDPKNRIKVIQYSGNIFKFISEINECEYFIGMRYHSSLFAYLLKKPQIIIDYQEKCKSLAKDILLPEYALLPLESLELDTLSRNIKCMINHPERYSARLSIEVAKDRVKQMYRYL